MGKLLDAIGKFVSGDWDDKVGQAITGATTKVGELGNNVSGVTSQNQFASQEAEKQRAWEKMMSDTSYQRAVADMKAAGLNPAMLYASGGNGASTPSGASANGSTGRAIDVLGQMGNFMNSINTARQIDYYTKRDESPKRTTEELYNSMGDLVKTIVRTSTK